MPTSPLLFALWLLVLAGSGFSLWKGGPPERLGGWVVLANLFLVMLTSAILPAGSQAVGELTVDGLTAVVLLGIVLIYGSLWLGGAMLLYAVQFTLHAFYFVTERRSDNLHAIVNNLDFMGIISCLVIGTIVAWRRRGRSAAAA